MSIGIKDREASDAEAELKLLCSFCGKTQLQVRKLIAGASVFICDECIDTCYAIINEKGVVPSRNAEKEVDDITHESVRPFLEDMKAQVVIDLTDGDPKEVSLYELMFALKGHIAKEMADEIAVTRQRLVQQHQEELSRIIDSESSLAESKRGVAALEAQIAALNSLVAARKNTNAWPVIEGDAQEG